MLLGDRQAYDKWYPIRQVQVLLVVAVRGSVFVNEKFNLITRIPHVDG